MIITVTSTADSGEGTLREALEIAAGSSGTRIEFSLSGESLIRVMSPLPPVSAGGTIIDGHAPGAVVPGVQIDGVECALGPGLLVTGGQCVIKGLAITRFGGYGIVVTGGDGNIIAGCHIGTDRAGTIALGNRSSGIHCSSARNLIGGDDLASRCVISGNGLYGVEIGSGPAAGENRIVGCHIGTTRNGQVALGNVRSGVLLYNAPNNTISRCVISGNGRGGVTIDGAPPPGGLVDGNPAGRGHCTGNLIADCRIGTNSTGYQPLPNGLRGILFNWCQANRAIGNTISGNGEDGVLFLGPETDSEPLWRCVANRVEGNNIGVKADGVSALGNARHGVHIVRGRQNVIGASTAATGNRIAHNGGHGVRASGSGAGTNVISSHNTVVDNARHPQVSIG